MNGIEFPIFYSAQIGIRFDIGDSSDLEVYINKRTFNPLYIQHCLDRATQIINSLPDAPDILAIQVNYIDEQGLKRSIKDVLSVTKLPQPQEIDKKEIHVDDWKENTAVLLWDLSKTNFEKETLLKEIIISDLGGEHLLTASVFWVWTNHKIMFHLYDDRGADLVASEKSAIKDIYTRFNNWILEYDRNRISSNFED